MGMHDSLLGLLLFAGLQNIDNFVVGAAYRFKSVSIPFPSNFLVSALSGLATGLACGGAQFVRSQTVRLGLEPSTEIVGRSLLLMIGTWTLVGYFRRRLFLFLNGDALKAKPILVERLKSCRMTPLQAVIPGIALAIDNVGPSFGFGLIRLESTTFAFEGVILALSTAIGSFVCIKVGQFVASRGAKVCRISPEVISGSLMISIALLDYV